jgi:hypothetical protein
MEQSALPDLRYVKVDEVEEVEGAPFSLIRFHFVHNSQPVFANIGNIRG